jgi:ribosomal protein L32
MTKQPEKEVCPQCGACRWVTGKKGTICSKCGFTKESDFFKIDGPVVIEK